MKITSRLDIEQRRKHQVRNALLLLGSKADPFERRGVSLIFKRILRELCRNTRANPFVDQ